MSGAMSERLARGWDRFLFAPEPATNLGVARILFCSYLFYQMCWDGFLLDITLYSLNKGPAFHFPGGIFKYLPSADPEQMALLYQIFRVALVLAIVGLATRVAMAVVGLLLFFMLSMNGMYGKLFYLDAIPIIAAGILAVSRAGDALSLDRVIKRRWARWPFTPAEVTPSGEYRWPLQVGRIYVCMVFFLAGLSKLWDTGPLWGATDNIATLLTSHPSNNFCIAVLGPYPDLSHWVASLPPPLLTAAGLTVHAIELTAPLALIPGRIRHFYLTAFLLLNGGFWILMGPPFHFLVVSYVTFLVPWRDLGLRLSRLRRTGDSPARTRDP